MVDWAGLLNVMSFLLAFHHGDDDDDSTILQLRAVAV